MKRDNNTLPKVLICTLVIYELIQINNYKKETEKLGVLKQNVSDLQNSLTQKEQEVVALTKKLEVEEEIENEKKIMEEEIKKLEKTATDLNKYMESTEQSLSALSKDIISEKTQSAIQYIKNKDFKKLAEMIHPTKNLRVSHTSEIKTNSEIIIKKEQLESLYSDETKYTWGITDGQGQLVKLTFKEFYEKYIYDIDYADKAEVIYNKFTQRPNHNNNVYQIFNSGIVVEYFYKGSKKNDYTDWKSLYLCFERYENSWYLSGIIHS